jgi:hypothetical protein
MPATTAGPSSAYRPRRLFDQKKPRARDEPRGFILGEFESFEAALLG